MIIDQIVLQYSEEATDGQPPRLIVQQLEREGSPAKMAILNVGEFDDVSALRFYALMESLEESTADL